jgi:predicted nuclease of predicted toxin-antitoxin system
MKLLLDQNLSPRLVQKLADLYPVSIHVTAVGLDSALDKDVWQYARQNQLIIVSKDADFNELSLVWGTPPKVIWIRRGNCSTKTIETLLRDHYEAIHALQEDDEIGTLAIF